MSNWDELDQIDEGFTRMNSAVDKAIDKMNHVHKLERYEDVTEYEPGEGIQVDYQYRCVADGCNFDTAE